MDFPRIPCPVCGRSFINHREVVYHLTDSHPPENPGGSADQGNRTVATGVERLEIHETIGEIMDAVGNTAAVKELSPADVQDDVLLLHEKQGEQLQKTEEQIASLEMRLEFQRGVRDMLERSRAALSEFLWPSEKARSLNEEAMEVRRG